MLIRDQIEKLEAGPEADELVTALVMGWRWAVAECDYPDLNDGRVQTEKGFFRHGFMPTRKIESAWEVMNKMAGVDEPWGLFEPALYKDKIGDSLWHCYLKAVGGRVLDASAKTAPLAICRLALLAVLDGKERG